MRSGVRKILVNKVPSFAVHSYCTKQAPCAARRRLIFSRNFYTLASTVNPPEQRPSVSAATAGRRSA